MLLLGAAGWAALPGGPAHGEVQPAGRAVVATGSTKGVYHGYGTVLAAQLHRRAPAG